METMFVKPSTVTDEERDLVFDDLLRGTVEALTAVEVPGLLKNGKPGVFYLRQLSAREVFEFADATGKIADEKPFEMLAKSLCKRDGSPMLTDEQIANGRIKDLPLDVLKTLVRSLFRTIGLITTDAEIKAAAEKAKLGEAVSDDAKEAEANNAGTPLGKG